MLYKLSLKNIKKSGKDYAIYFFTLILGVAIFYIFNALESQTVMMNVSSNTRHIIKLMNNALSGVSVLVSIILGFLIIYASRFLIKRRNKEFGIYLTLGMSKRKISLLLLLETLLIGIISLIIGLIIGITLSQLMSLLVANMFEADLTKFTFIFSKSGALKTIIYFGIIYIVVMIFNVINISKCKLIALIKSSKKSEKIKLKNPIICTIIFIVSVLGLSYAYYLVTSGLDKLTEAYMIFKPIIIGIITTFLIFWSLSGLLLKIFMNIRILYHKSLNSFTLRQISSKINTTVFSMTIICLMLFVTICILSSALSLKNSMTKNLTELTPIDIEMKKQYNINENYKEDEKLTIEETLNKMSFNGKDYLEDITIINTYSVNEIKLKDTLGNYYEKLKNKMPMYEFYINETFIKLSDYNKIAELYNLEKLNLNKNEYILVANYENMGEIRNKSLELNTKITLNNIDYYPKYKKYKEGFIDIAANHSNTGFFVVADEALKNAELKENILLANYKSKNKEEKQKIEDLIINMEKHPYYNETSLKFETKLSVYESSVGLGAMVTFIGLYLGIIFLISSAALLALKELSESTDNKERYQVLRRLGADEKLINKSLFRQIGIFFLFPLLLAIIHSIFGLIFSNKLILSSLGNEKIIISIIMTAIFLILIYGGYFLITYICSKNIIKD